MTKVKDPVCQMVVESGSAAAHGSYGGKRVYFCSVVCQKSYEKTHRPSP